MAAPLQEKENNFRMSTQTEAPAKANQAGGDMAENASEESREPSPISNENNAGNATENAAATGGGAESNRTDKREAAKARRREDKAIEAVLKALGSLESTEEKLAALCKKYADLLEDNRRLQTKFKQSQKSVSVIMREKDQLQSEHSKAVLAKSTLENICRELQRNNKQIQDQSVARAKEEEDKRKEVTSKFQTTINDIQSQMNDHYQKNTKLREDNAELATKLKSLTEQYELREQHVEKVFKHKELELQLAEAKLEQANLQLSETLERTGQEKHILMLEAAEAHKRVHLLEEQEQELRTQVSRHSEKYKEFEQTLTKSNEVFQTFKSEMDKMTKQMKKTEKETRMWKSRSENSNRSLLEMAEEKTKSDTQIMQLNNKISKLESLCRALQEERRKNTRPNGVLPPDASQVEGSSTKSEAEPTKTPPNTPDQSRSSPITVQEENGATSSPSEDTASPSDETASATEPSASEPTASEPTADQPKPEVDSQNGDIEAKSEEAPSVDG